jgi:YidC/Oxa1 family membrane protein insertase
LIHPRSLSRILVALILVALASPLAFAQNQNGFATYPFAVSEFRDYERLRTACAEPVARGFLCAELDGVLTRIPTKGVDLFFTQAGEVAAAFAKFQKGQRLSNYSADNADNLIPRDAPIPGGAILLDGVYHRPTEVTGGWTRLSDEVYEGRFSYLIDGVPVEKRIVVSNVSHTIDVEVDVGEAVDEARSSPEVVALAFPGIGRQQQPTIKIGQGETFSLNPISQPVGAPRYISLQSAANNTGNALIMVPAPGGDPLQAINLGERRIAMQAAFDGGASLRVHAYLGKNELVRFWQEGYLDLPGLFTPNILGRMSLWVLLALQAIHEYVPSWGLSIIVLTLFFRALVWPLITTQTRSMFGMQRLQPEMKKLQEKYKNDREKLSQEMMKLYKEAGVNPAGGCLPILLQMPLFIILWRVFVNFEFAEGFLWLPDLGSADPFFILPALYVGVMLAQSYYSARGNPTMLRQAMIINLVFVFIIVGFPAGVLLYFVVSMLVQVFQYWLLSRGNPPPPVPAKAKAKS